MENIKISENSKKNNISLEELSLEISKKFWLESKKISLLIKKIRENSVYSLENLKAELQKENKTLELQKIQELFSDLQKARNIFGKESKKSSIIKSRSFKPKCWRNIFFTKRYFDGRFRCFWCNATRTF